MTSTFELHAVLFDHREALEDDNLGQYAADLDLDAAVFASRVRRTQLRPRVPEDFERGVGSGVLGTPTFYDEIRYDGLVGVRQFLAAIQGAHPDVVIEAGRADRTTHDSTGSQAVLAVPTVAWLGRGPYALDDSSLEHLARSSGRRGKALT